MTQKMLSRFFSLRELLSECSHSQPVFELWSGSIVVELQDVLRKKSAFHCRGHWAARLHSEAERHAPGATHLSRSRLQRRLLLWVAVEVGDSHLCQQSLRFAWHSTLKCTHAELETTAEDVAFFNCLVTFSCMSGKSGSRALLWTRLWC